MLTVERAAGKSGREGKEEHRRVLERLEVKQQIIAELIAGRIDLFRAAERFQAVQPGGSEVSLEQTCRVVIGWAHLALGDWPERAEAVSDRLEKELAAQRTLPEKLRRVSPLPPARE